MIQIKCNNTKKGMVKIVKEKSSPQVDLYLKLIDEFRECNRKIDSVVKLNERILSMQMEILRLLNKKIESSYSEEPGEVLDVKALLSLPASLRKTMLALYKLREATAEDLSNETKRLRAVESDCANQLTRMGYLKKKRVGRNVYFYIENSFGGLEER